MVMEVLKWRVINDLIGELKFNLNAVCSGLMKISPWSLLEDFHKHRIENMSRVVNKLRL